MKIGYLLCFLGFALMLSISSCTEKEQYKDTEKIFWNDFGEVIPLKGEVLPLEDDIFKPVRILATGSILYLSNMDSPKLLQIIDLNSGHKKNLGEFIPFGSGPQEMTNISRLQKIGNSLYLYDVGQSLLNEFRINDTLPVYEKSIRFKYSFDDWVLTRDSSLVALALDSDMKRLSLFQKGEFMYTFGEFPQIEGARTMTPIESLEGFSANLVMDKKTERIAIAYKNTDLIEIYKVDGSLIRRVHGPEHFFPEVFTRNFDNGTQKAAYESGKSRDAYFFPDAYGNHFYVLFSGKVFDKNVPGYLMEWILVFDWEGNPVKRYQLDKPIFAFSIDQQTGILYGISDDPEFQVLKYLLN